MKNSCYKEKVILLFCVYCCFLLNVFNLKADDEFQFDFSVETISFLNSSDNEKQSDNYLLLYLKPEYYKTINSNSSLLFDFSIRTANGYENNINLDVQECYYAYNRASWELLIGVNKVFWGVTEYAHIVDIINQTDTILNTERDRKLGQPMIKFSVFGDYGNIDAFVLPYFRERLYSTESGRLRSRLIVDTSKTIYQDDYEYKHIDYAIRFSNTFKKLDYSVHYFSGTGREPLLLMSYRSNEQPYLIPFYEQISQIGVDLQMAVGQWLFKAESFYRDGYDENFIAGAIGLEYPFPGIFSSYMDLNIFNEWAFDERSDGTKTPYNNLFIFGFKLTGNNVSGTQLKLGFAQQIETNAKTFKMEASQRLNNSMLFTLKAGLFWDQTPHDYYYSLENDDFISLALSCFF